MISLFEASVDFNHLIKSNQDEVNYNYRRKLTFSYKRFNSFRFFVAVLLLGSAVAASNYELVGDTEYITIRYDCYDYVHEWTDQYTAVIRNLTYTGTGDTYVDYAVGSGAGSLKPGTSLKDVQGVFIENQSVRWLPRNIHRFFFQMTFYRVENSGLEFIDNGIFYSGAKIIHLDNNIIKNVPVGVFKDLPNLEWISMNDNRIETLQPGVFDGLTKLRVASFNGNQIRRIGSNLFRDNVNLEKVSFHGNGLANVAVDLVEHLSNLKIANFDSNICINDAYFNDPNVVQNLKTQFSTYCSGQCDQMREYGNDAQSLERRYEELKRQNRIYRQQKKAICHNERRNKDSTSSSSSSSESNE